MKRWILFVLLSLASFGANATLFRLKALLDGAQEVPQTTQAAVGGSGFAVMLFDDTTYVLSWTISYSLNTGPANAAHFHGATNPGDLSGVGIVSPIRIPIPDIAGTSSGTVNNSFDLYTLVNPADNVSNLLAGLWYVNIHTPTFPSGEIRGQITVVPPGTVVEYYNPDLDHYFIAADPGEQAFVDSGAVGRWQRTGVTFKSGGNVLVCRFYGSLSPGPNSHFYTASADECAQLKQLQATTPATQKRWNFESFDFLTMLPINGTCPAATTPVYRAYNNGFSKGIDSNHRIANNQTAIQEVVARGWINEGLVMCAPPQSQSLLPSY